MDSEAKLKQLHLIVVPYPAQGHLGPLMNLSTALAQAGASVSVVNIEPVHRQLQTSGRLLSMPNLRLVSVPFDLEAPAGVDSFWYNRLREFSQAMLRCRGGFQDVVGEIISRAEFRKYVLISDHLMSFREIALQAGALFVHYWPGAAHWYLIHHHLQLMASLGDIPVKDPHKLITYVPGIQPLRLADFPNYVQPNNPEGENLDILIQDPLPVRNEWFFINSVYDMEPGAFDTVRELLGSRCVAIAPSFPLEETCPPSFSLREENISCLAWLGKQDPRSVLYVSFGSITPLGEADVLTLAQGLELSNVKFLWVVKKEHFPREHAGSFSEFVDRVKDLDQGVVIEWAPQREVLAHGAVAGFVSHCGWNSVIESICSGVPIIGWPCISEQRLNCKLVVEDWKMGMRMNKVDKHEVKLAVTEFMSNREVFAIKAEACKRVARASVLGDNLKTFLREILE